MADKEPVVRAHAAWALGRIKDGLARKALEKAAEAENEPLVKVEIQNSLEKQ
jgi:HEAT repeat protein